MDPFIDSLLKELSESDLEIRSNPGEWEEFLKSFVGMKPDSTMDESFAENLKKTLLNHAADSESTAHRNLVQKPGKLLWLSRLIIVGGTAVASFLITTQVYSPSQNDFMSSIRTLPQIPVKETSSLDSPRKLPEINSGQNKDSAESDIFLPERATIADGGKTDHDAPSPSHESSNLAGDVSGPIQSSRPPENNTVSEVSVPYSGNKIVTNHSEPPETSRESYVKPNPIQSNVSVQNPETLNQEATLTLDTVSGDHNTKTPEIQESAADKINPSTTPTANESQELTVIDTPADVADGTFVGTSLVAPLEDNKNNLVTSISQVNVEYQYSGEILFVWPRQIKVYENSLKSDDSAEIYPSITMANAIEIALQSGPDSGNSEKTIHPQLGNPRIEQRSFYRGADQKTLWMDALVFSVLDKENYPSASLPSEVIVPLAKGALD